MPSQALIKFNDTVDASNLGDGAKVAVKAWGRLLYPAAVREAGEHIRYHLKAEYAARPQSPELTARRDLISTVLDRNSSTNDTLALSIADALDA